VSASPVNSPSEADITPTPSDSCSSTDQFDQGNISNIERWGFGPIRSVAFSSTGRYFLVATPYGYALYNNEKVDHNFEWVQISPPFEGLEFASIDEDNKKVCFEGSPISYRCFEIDSGKDIILEFEPTLGMVKKLNGVNEIELKSNNEKLIYKGKSKYKESPDGGTTDEQTTIEEVFNAATNKKKFDLGDGPQYLQYAERTTPEGCDLDSFSMCGNAYLPIPWAPLRAIFSPNDKYLGVLYNPAGLFTFEGKYRILKIYNASTGRLIKSFGSVSEPVVDFAFDPKSEQLLIGMFDGSVKLWNINDWKNLWRSKNFTQPSVNYQTTTDGKFILYQGILGNLEVRDLSNGKVIGNYESSSFALSPIHNLLAIGKKNGVIQIIDLETQKRILEFSGHRKKVLSLKFSPDEKKLVTSSEDCSIYSWEIKTGSLLQSYGNTYIDPYEMGEKYESRVFIKDFVFLDDSDKLFGFGSWGTVLNWDGSSGKLNYHVSAPPLDFYHGMMTVNPHFPEGFSVDEKLNQFSIGESFYDLNTGKPIEEKQELKSPDTYDDINCTTFGPTSKDGKTLFAIGKKGLERNICVIDVTTGKLKFTFSIFAPIEHSIIEIGLPFLSTDGSTLFVPTSDGVTFVFKVPE
jgi:WD40 repeat protein